MRRATLKSIRTAVCIAALVAMQSHLSLGMQQSAEGLSSAAADDAGSFDRSRLAAIKPLVEQAISQGRLPGAVVCIGWHGDIVYLETFGNRQLEPEVEPMTTDTVFDLASLTKPIATATSIMQLVEQGRVRLRDPVARYIPEFAAHGKSEVTLFQLLTHTSGLIADNSLDDYQQGPVTAIQKICDLELKSPPGESFAYSDVGFIVLGEIVQRVSGQTLDIYAREHIFRPLGMSETGFGIEPSLKGRTAPTERRDGRWIRGEVHDPRAFRMGGVAGHAGLFSTASDLARYAQMVLDRGRRPQPPVLSSQSIQQMGQSIPVSTGFRTLGWDKLSGYSSNRGELMTAAAFGHGGFTGTAMWIDPELELYVIFLSNRLHPDGRGSVNDLAGRIGTIAAACVPGSDTGSDKHAGPLTAGTARDRSSLDYSPVLTGIDVLEQEQFRLLRSKRIGLITNQTGFDRKGRSTIEVLAAAPDVKLVAIFSPEHGVAGELDQNQIADAVDATTGLPIYSLYGDRRKPTEQQLADLDLLVFDIQDIGTRFYTYVSTMGLAMQAAAAGKVGFVVLDRPNPINGLSVGGPLLDSGKESFVGFHPIPVRHGMTAGELAKMIQIELKLDLDLYVVPLRGWRRSDYFDQTGLVWRNPSPNMRNLNEAILYPGIGLLETTNVSVGRGTDTPFEVVGAPFITSPREFARRLNLAGLGGVHFVPVYFTPTSSIYRQQLCGGVQILIENRMELDPIRIGFTMAAELRDSFPDQWKIEGFQRLLGCDRVYKALVSGASAGQLCEISDEISQPFARRRERFLLYVE